MTKPLRFDDEAAEELEAAAAWYETRRSGLGLDLVLEVRRVLDRIAAHPAAAPLARDEARQFGVRLCTLRRFPYSIAYVELEAELRVIAVAHHRREPGYWRPRL
jgi:toxin ParE1/3/4